MSLTAAEGEKIYIHKNKYQLVTLSVVLKLARSPRLRMRSSSSSSSSFSSSSSSSSTPLHPFYTRHKKGGAPCYKRLPAPPQLLTHRSPRIRPSDDKTVKAWLSSHSLGEACCQCGRLGVVEAEMRGAERRRAPKAYTTRLRVSGSHARLWLARPAEQGCAPLCELGHEAVMDMEGSRADAIEPRV